MSKVYILYPTGDYKDEMLKELSLKRNFIAISSKLSLINKIIRKISKILKINLSIIYLFKKFSRIKDDKDIKIIIFDTFWLEEIKYIERKFPKAQKRVWYWNKIRDEDFISFFDKENIYTFDKADSKKYKLKYINQFYWKNIEKIENIKTLNKHLVYCLAMNKNRLVYIEKIYLKLKELGIKTDFYIVRDKNEKSKILNLKTVFLTYSENIKRIKNSTCILEIVKENQTGLTLRALEALFFKKKLITNNKNIKDYNFYSPQNILYIESENDLEADFFYKDIVNVDEFIEDYKIEKWFDEIIK